MTQKLTLLAIALLFVGLVAHRVWRYANISANMPSSLAEAQERELCLTPAGAYTLADIEANGRTYPSQKFRGLSTAHDFRPQPNDRLCPITHTKANPNITWTVAGQVYEFCCPPCISEFVRLAKDRPDHIQLPESYVKK
jgi:hypothetical protein